MNKEIIYQDTTTLIAFEDLREYVKNASIGDTFLSVKDGKYYRYLVTDKGAEPVWIQFVYTPIDSRLISISEKTYFNELLCQLSEECGELTQACLKYRRAKLGLTPKTEEETLDNLAEEIADVSILIDTVMYMMADKDLKAKVEDVKERKIDRWWRRTFISMNEN